MTTYMKLVKGATKIKMAPPKQKYIDPILLGTTQGQDFNEIVRALDTRISDSAWTIVYKTMAVVHLMIREGEKDVAIRYFSRNIGFFNIDNVMNSGHNGQSFELRVLDHYTEYIRTRCQEYANIQTDYVRDGHSSLRSIINDNRSKSLDTALNHVESLEIQISMLLKNKLSQNDLSNDLLLFTFKLLIFDLLALYNALNEGIITLLESFFELSHRNAERTLDLYKRFVILTESVVKYLKAGKSVGLKIPVIKHITTKLVRSLEEHLREDDVTHNTFNDELANGASPSKDFAQQRLDEIREQKRQLQEQLAQPQLMITPTGVQSINNPFSAQVTRSMTMPVAQEVPALPTLSQQVMNNPFMSSTQAQMQQPQFQQQVQPQVQPAMNMTGMPLHTAVTMSALPAQSNQFMTGSNNNATMQMPLQTANTMGQAHQTAQISQAATFAGQPIQVPQQGINNQMSFNYTGVQAPQNINPMVQPQLQMQHIQAPQMAPQMAPELAPVSTGTKNPFSFDNIGKAKQTQEVNNPFAKTNYQETTTTQRNNTNMFGNLVAAQAPQQETNNPFSLQQTSGNASAVIIPPSNIQYQQQHQQFQQQQQQQPNAYEMNLIDM